MLLRDVTSWLSSVELPHLWETIRVSQVIAAVDLLDKSTRETIRELELAISLDISLRGVSILCVYTHSTEVSLLHDTIDPMFKQTNCRRNAYYDQPRYGLQLIGMGARRLKK